MLRLGTQMCRQVALNVKTGCRTPSSSSTQKLVTRKMTQQRTPVDWTTSIPTKAAKDKEKIAPLGWFLLLIPATTFGLGCWQVKRKIWKEQLIKDLSKQLNTAPVDLPEDLSDLSHMEYRMVKIRGRFLHEKEMRMGPRSLIRPDGVETQGGLFSQRDSGNGYLIVTPFQLADRDDIVLVNRGWVSRKQVEPETRPLAQLKTEVELTAVVRKGEARPQFTPDHKGNIYLYRDLARMCASTGAAPVFLDATYDVQAAKNGPIGGQTRVTLRNDHLSYLVTWFSLSAATSFLWYRQIVKRIPF
ncbi:LOW QUALITY PROTEIN: SURF1-like protein [Drosophila gunungcola]|uniref:LOW QUALITY PROTEIN: SURF1-like protein n=1 Tax=Drosophila gunungcola TaxID=103775 RepID=UPI0022DFF72A|nr:LOW QUALITY PROTEIN: SURF1-like protein [Drosophila gunungcola]